MSNHFAIKVYIRNQSGEYLAADGDDWEFTAGVERAHIFDYDADQVAAQLEQVAWSFGIVWTAVPVDPSIVCESCDACGKFVAARFAHFDGVRFLCADCRSTGSNLSQPVSQPRFAPHQPPEQSQPRLYP
jgi:hypothetical protein